MSILKRKTKTGYTKNYYYDITVNGKTYRGTTKTANKKLALDIEAKARLEIIKFDELGIKKPIKLYDALDLLKQKYDEKEYETSVPTCIERIKKLLNDKPIHKLKSTDLYEMLDKLKAKEHVLKNGTVKKLKPKTLENYFSIIQQAQTLVRKRDHLVNSDLEMPDIKVDSTRVRIMEDYQRVKILERLKPNQMGQGMPIQDPLSIKYRQMQDNYDVCLMLMDTGCRYSEIAGLKWSDVDLKKTQIRVWRGKTKSETHLFMSDNIISLLNRRLRHNPHPKWIFTDSTGKSHRKYTTISIRKAIKGIEGLENFNVHDLRHCAASTLINAGMTLQKVAVVLGHSDIRMTMKYAHLDKKQITQEAVDIMNRGGNIVNVQELVENA